MLLIKNIGKKHLTLLGMLVGIAVLGIGLKGVIKQHIKTTGIPLLPVSTHTITTDTTLPDEKKPSQDQLANYSVPATEPRSIRISSVDIFGLVQKVGFTKDGAVSVPTNIYFAGWHTGSVLPGYVGLSIIDGHVSGQYNDAVFMNLKNVQANDEVEIEFGDKSIKKFSVVEVKTLAEADSSVYLFTKKPNITTQLNLITCGGKYNSKTQTFADRVIVVAKLI
jgi:hypothetical protein